MTERKIGGRLKKEKTIRPREELIKEFFDYTGIRI